MSSPRAILVASGLAVLAALCGVSKADMIIPVDPGDARGCRDWGNGFRASNWVDSQTSLTLAGDYDPSDSWYRYWYVPVLEFPISSLSGAAGVQATLNLYVEGVNGGAQIRYGSDDNGVIEPSDWLNFGTTVASLADGTTGWVHCDISDQLQSLVDQGAPWAVFTVRSSDWWCGATIRASEYAGFSPYLSVTPEPATMSLLALASLGLLKRRHG